MIFNQKENGSCDIEFSWKERFILFKKGKLHLSNESLKHFGNVLMKIVYEWNEKFDEKTQKIHTKNDTKIEGK
jgi:hypothetical protein